MTGPAGIQRWGVVGGGLLGLRLAQRLREAGHQVTVLESAPQIGGLASAWQLGSVTWDRFYHVLLLSDTTLRSLLEVLGLTSELRWTTTRTGFFAGGRLHPFSGGFDFLRFPALGIVGKLRLAATIFYASRIRDWRPLEDQTVGDWLRRLSGTTTYRAIWQPLLRAKLGDAAERTSAAFIWATINRLYKARRTGLKHERFGYVAGGYATILDRLTEWLKAQQIQIECGWPVERVERIDDRVQVTARDGRRQEFDRVVVTAPAPLLPAMVPQLSPLVAESFAAAEYLGVVCVSLLLRRPLSPYYVTNITDSQFTITGVIETTNVVATDQLAGHSLVYLPKYVAPDDPLQSASDDEIVTHFVRDLRKIHPHLSDADVVASRVARAKHVMVVPTLGYSRRLPPLVTGVEGVYAVSSARLVNDTLNVNSTLELADSAMPELLASSITAIPHQGQP